MIRPYPLDDNQNAYLAGLGHAVNAGNVTGGKGIRVSKTSGGTRISAQENPRKDNLTWQSFYDFTLEYFPNDVILIPTSSVLDQNGNPLSLTPGATYVCVNYVPPSSNNTSSFATVVTSFGGTVSNDMANAYRWYQYNNYYPVSINPVSSSAVVDSSGYTIIASQSFWRQLGGTSAGMTFRGYWNSAITYNLQDMVVIQSGISAGTYVSIAGSNTSNPATGVNWIQIAAGGNVNNWT